MFPDSAKSGYAWAPATEVESRIDFQLHPKPACLDLLPLVHLEAGHGCSSFGCDAVDFQAFLGKSEMPFPFVAPGVEKRNLLATDRIDARRVIRFVTIAGDA